MNFFVPRTCTVVSDSQSGGADTSDVAGSKTLRDYRSTSAYVLLGNPGFGKTTEFERESNELGDKALMISARDFIALDHESRREWTGKVLFIDGLDEIRSGGNDARIPLDKIRSRLDQLGPPAFRISCREADWLGQSDRMHLERVSRDKQIRVLRLDELKDGQILELLCKRYQQTANEAQAFIAEAQQRKVDGLLVNPLTLGLLVDAVRGGGDWPDSRRKTLELACQHLATEHNEEHEIGGQAELRPGPQAIVDVAGYLCALLLLSDGEGFVLRLTDRTPSFPELSELANPPAPISPDDFAPAVSTKMFKALGGGFAPLHRQVAEFLAGRFIAKLFDNGLPAKRVIALLTGPSDGGVVTSLRGLSAWLAVHSSELRRLLIEVDPIGVGLYGDIGDLAVSDRKRLLRSLAAYFENNPQQYLGLGDEIGWAFRILATAEMVPVIETLLRVEAESPAQQRLLQLILKVLACAEDRHAVAELKDDLEAILWCTTIPALIREHALHAYLHIVDSSEERNRTLRRLIDAVGDGSIADPDDQIRGTLLSVLFPEAVTPAEVWRYLAPRNHKFFGAFWGFWEETLVQQSSSEHLAELLDALHEQSSNLSEQRKHHVFQDTLMELLARCLETNSEIQDDPERLYFWLESVSGLGRRPKQDESERRVRTWLEERPEVQKRLVQFSLRKGHSESHIFHAHGVLFGSKLPPDFGRWCLDLAIRIAENEPKTARHLLWHAYRSLNDPSISDNLTFETMRERTCGLPILAEYLEELCRPSEESQRTDDEFERKMAEEREQWCTEQRQRREVWAKHLREQEQELRENRFAPQNLSTLAVVYLGLLNGGNRGASPQDRIKNFIGEDAPLVDAVLTAFRDTLRREDLPEVAHTISLLHESRKSFLADPVLAGIDLMEREGPETLDGLTDSQKRKILAIYYCVPHTISAPRWHSRWFEINPEMVLDVLFDCAVAKLRADKNTPYGLHVLDGVEGYEELLNDFRLRLLEAFPTRSSKSQMQDLDPLLSRTLEYHDNSHLLSLARRKQTLKSMPIAQRVRWWATDALISQGKRLGELRSEFAESEVRMRHLAEFLRPIWDRFDGKPSILTAIRDPATLEDMIGILGRWWPPWLFGGESGTLEMGMSDLIFGLVDQLGSDPSEQAERNLKCLIADPGLNGWRLHLQRALEEQRVIRRDSSYKPPSLEQVQKTLNDAPPANAADLAALLRDHFDAFQSDLRGGDSDIWRQFWNEGQHGDLTAQKPENSCRDALVSNLKFRLPDEVELLREGSHAANTRDDVQARCGGFKVPVEIKKDSHSDLWTAPRDQLMAKYTTDPDSDGYGIYLVLWFADSNKPATRHSDGTRPSSPEELKQRLDDDLSPEESRKISVIVVDVTKPTSSNLLGCAV
ncbi:MAG: hypothetical protein KTU85_10035 [Acidimicrobiia bacterium]|nr:hypothetical protein [Acidimicrobiia bacterium]MCY4457721.1 hypothetical protein [Acidimicrobiaceae bacterium]